jgi:hypothetical protein
MGFGLVNLFLDYLQVVSTNNYNIIVDYHNLQITLAYATVLSLLDVSW